MFIKLGKVCKETKRTQSSCLCMYY